MISNLETTTELLLKAGKDVRIPIVLQDIKTKSIVGVSSIDEFEFEKASKSSSIEYNSMPLSIYETRINCNQDSILYQVIAEGIAPQYISFDKSKGNALKFGENGLIPVVTQDSKTGEVLILSFANKEAIDKTLALGVATYWKRSTNKLWIKGDTSGDYLKIDGIKISDKGNSLIYEVTPQGEGACHAKDENGIARPSCYYRKIIDNRLEFT